MKQRRLWTEDELKLVFFLYCQTPFGKLHAKYPEIISLASFIGRSSGALAMKLVNFASMDPDITGSGRKGLGNASALDRKVWNQFCERWEQLAIECGDILKQNNIHVDADDSEEGKDYYGKTRKSMVESRIGQNFFRRSVLANFQSRCCMSGMTNNRLLIASHIIPWKESPKDRLNPRNGLCLSALHDRAFDKGLITVQPDGTINVSREVLMRANESAQTLLLAKLEGNQILLPEKFLPDPEFLSWHNQNLFLR